MTYLNVSLISGDGSKGRGFHGGLTPRNVLRLMFWVLCWWFRPKAVWLFP